MPVIPRPFAHESFIRKLGALGAGFVCTGLVVCLSGCTPPTSGKSGKSDKSGQKTAQAQAGPAATPASKPQAPAAPVDDGCCRYCFSGTPCGDACIDEGKTCEEPEDSGCACAKDKFQPRKMGPRFRVGPGQGLLGPEVWAYNQAMGDPIDGPFTLDMAFEGAPELADKSKGTLTAVFETSMGSFECELYEDQAPLTVANFVGLARGVRPYQDPRARGAEGKEWTKGRYYDGTTFHRVIKGFMVQGGDPSATGHGTPGYFIPDEFDPKLRHDGPGYLSMANRNPYVKATNKPKYDAKTGLTIGNTGSAQFFITVAPTMALNDRHTIFGKCPKELPTQISEVKVMSRPMPNKPFEDVVIEKLDFVRK